jgi:hypothetical protein
MFIHKNMNYFMNDNKLIYTYIINICIVLSLFKYFYSCYTHNQSFTICHVYGYYNDPFFLSAYLLTLIFTHYNIYKRFENFKIVSNWMLINLLLNVSLVIVVVITYYFNTETTRVIHSISTGIIFISLIYGMYHVLKTKYSKLYVISIVLSSIIFLTLRKTSYKYLFNYLEIPIVYGVFIFVTNFHHHIQPATQNLFPHTHS